MIQVIAMSDKEEERQQAIAVKYDKERDYAPKVVAKGAGHVAGQILAAAASHAVPVYRNKTLAAMLMAVELDREIPPELYQAVAEILVYVYQLDQKKSKR